MLAKRKRKEVRKRQKEAAASVAIVDSPEATSVTKTAARPAVVVASSEDVAVRRPLEEPPVSRPRPKQKKIKSKDPRSTTVESSRSIEAVGPAVAPDIIEISDMDVDEQPISQPAVRSPKKKTKSKKSKTVTAEPSRPIEPATPIAAPDVIEILDTDDEEDSTPAIAIPPFPLTVPTAPQVAVAAPPPTRDTVLAPGVHVATQPPSKKKKVSSSTDKAEKAARKQARAERRQRKAERRARKASGEKQKAKGAPKKGQFALMLAATMGEGSTRKKSSRKETKEKAPKPGPEKKIEDPVELARREKDAEERFERMLLEVGNTAALPATGMEQVEEAWKTELRSTKDISNEKLTEHGRSQQFSSGQPSVSTSVYT